MILNAKFTKFGQLSANEVTRYNIPNYLAFSHWAYDTQEFGDYHRAKSWNSILKDVEEESNTK